MMKENTEKILYGFDDTRFIVAIDYDSSTSEAVCFVRSDEKVSKQRERFSPFVLINREEILDIAGVSREGVQLSYLAGEKGFKVLARFPDYESFRDALSKLGQYYRKEKDNLVEDPYQDVGEIPHQYMLLSGKTHFLGMNWEDVKKLHLAVKLNVNPEFANPKNPEQVIYVLGIKVNGDEIFFDLDHATEPEMIRKLVEIVNRCDPDVICGHNLYKFIFSFISERARRYKIPLAIGRDSKVAVTERYRMPLAERRLEFPRLRVFGRSLIDSWLLVQTYDIFKREMDSYELAYSAEHLGVRERPREQLQSPPPGSSYTHFLPQLIEDTRQDLRDVEGIVSTLIPTFFYLCQMLPYSLEDTIIRGNATKINSFFLREYLRQKTAIPEPIEARWYPGGYTEIRKTGVLGPVISADVTSLYPTLILTKKLFPASDRLGLFEKILRELLNRRLEVKRTLKKLSADEPEYHRLDAQQGTFKIIINSFYGYLGTDRMNFADIDVAEKVTAEGQAIVKHMAEVIEKLGGEIVEVDTDGIYLCPPKKFVKSKNYEDFIELVNKQMPKGVTVELGGVYQAMLSYKVKNYALLSLDDKLEIKGSGLKSRGLEPFLRMFIESAIRLVLRGKGKEIDGLYKDFLHRLKAGDFSVAELAKTETLVDSLETYEKKIKTTRRNPQAQYEVAKRMSAKSGVAIKPGDAVTYYISGDSPKVKAYEFAKHINEYNPEKPDINIPFYEKRLAETYKRVKEFAS